MRRVCAVTVLAVAIGGCGRTTENGQEPTQELAVSEQELVAPDSCAVADFDKDTCSGAWQYPSRCCVTGYGQYNSCNHASSVTNFSYTQSVTAPSTAGCYRDCNDYKSCVWVCPDSSFDCSPAQTNAMVAVNNQWSGC